MPIFEYRCRSCDHRFGFIVGGPARPRCPLCDGEHLEKQLSVFAVGTGGPAAAAPARTLREMRGSARAWRLLGQLTVL